MWKFNKWLFLSQCSHNWWSEMGMDARQRFWFSELIVIKNQLGRMGVRGRRRYSDLPRGPSYVTTQTESVWGGDDWWKLFPPWFATCEHIGASLYTHAVLNIKNKCWTAQFHWKMKNVKWVHPVVSAYSVEAVQHDMLGACVLLYQDRK